MSIVSERVIDLGGVYDLPRSLGVLQRGHGDPSFRVDPGRFDGGRRGTPGAGAWWGRRVYGADGAELGQAVLRLDQLAADQVRVRATATEEAAVDRALEDAAGALGAEDDWTELEFLLDALGDRISTELATIRRRHPGVRLPATGALFEQLTTVILEQKVTHAQARHAWRNLLKRHGDIPPEHPALPAPDWMRLPLNPLQLSRVPSWEWHRMWVQPPLARSVLQLAGRAAGVHRLSIGTPAETTAVHELAEQLTTIPGIGPWTAAEALQRSHGAVDLPSVGDYHLSAFVGEALTGQRTDDAGMLRLLEPFRPHRQRIVRLLVLSGFRAQRYGPKLAPEDHRGR